MESFCWQPPVQMVRFASMVDFGGLCSLGFLWSRCTQGFTLTQDFTHRAQYRGDSMRDGSWTWGWGFLRAVTFGGTLLDFCDPSAASHKKNRGFLPTFFPHPDYAVPHSMTAHCASWNERSVRVELDSHRPRKLTSCRPQYLVQSLGMNAIKRRQM